MSIDQNKSFHCTPIQDFGYLGRNKLFVKRDDLLPFSFGGNKARKAKLFFEEIDCCKSDCVVTYGTSSSNHCRVVANLAAQRNIKCIIISPREQKKHTFNNKMVELLGAKIVYCPVDSVKSKIDSVMAQAKNNGYNPYFIMGGGHGNIGTKAYVECYKEIEEYEQRSKIHFDFIFHATGTGTTQAGLVVGQIISKAKRKIVGISIARNESRGRPIVIESIKNYLSTNAISCSDKIIDANTVFCDKYIESGYGKTSVEIKDTIKKVLIEQGLALDETYTGKAFYGMSDYIKNEKIESKNVLFLHTGGTPLFFDFLLNEGKEE